MVKLQDYTATEKEELTLQCELSKDVPVMWYHDKKELIASKTVAIRSEGTSRSLVLKKVSQSNQGCYECDCGTDKTSANITVEGKHDEIAANEPALYPGLHVRCKLLSQNDQRKMNN